MPYDIDLKEVQLEEDQLSFQHKGSKASVDVSDVIGYHVRKAESSPPKIIKGAKPEAAVNVLYIQRSKDPKVLKWTTETLNVLGDVKEAEGLLTGLEDKMKVLTRPKKLLVLMNPIGGRQNARSIYQNMAGPLFELAGIHCEVLVSERAKHMPELVANFDTSSVDGIVILGGDGTVCEVLNALMKKFHGTDLTDLKPLDIPIGVLPTGTGNGFCEGLYGVPDEMTSVLHIIKAKTRRWNLLGVNTGGRVLSIGCCVVAYGLFGDIMYHTDKQRWMKRARYVVMPMYCMLIKKQRVFNARITYRIREKQEKEDTEDAAQASDVIIEKVLDGQTECISLMSVNYHKYGSLNVGFKPWENQLGKLMTPLKTLKPCRGASLVKMFLDMGMRKETAFNKDFIDIYTVLSYKVKVLPPSAKEKVDKEKLAREGTSVDGDTVKATKANVEGQGEGDGGQKVKESQESSKEEGVKSEEEVQKGQGEQVQKDGATVTNPADGATSADSAGGATSADPMQLTGKREGESEEEYLQRLIDIDGELFEIIDNEYEVRTYMDIMNVYSSVDSDLSLRQQ